MRTRTTLKFTPWMSWEHRRGYQWRRMAGIYIVAISKKSLDGKRPSWADVSYIGMTNSAGGLLSRWNQFDTAIHGGGRHSGGRTIFKDLGDYKHWRKRLFVAACALKCNVVKKTRTAADLMQMGWIAFLEYNALAECRRVIGREPKYNTK